MGNIVRKLPIGIQSFDKLRTENYLYVDKTEFIYQMAYQGVPYFLSRPRRFGKSLLLSTFKAYFEGKKELFRGLAIEKLETEWKEHPVLHFSLNAELYDSRKALENMLERQLREWEKIYDTGGEGITYSGRFMTIIRRAAEITGRKVVVLIDEYDKPLLRNLHNEELQNEFRELLTAFYTVLKDALAALRIHNRCHQVRASRYFQQPKSFERHQPSPAIRGPLWHDIARDRGDFPAGASCLGRGE